MSPLEQVIPLGSPKVVDLSQLGKPKYCLVTSEGGYWPDLIPYNPPDKSTKFTGPGIYQWQHAFRGEIRLFKDMKPKDFTEYDLIHLNTYGETVHMQMAQKIREHIKGSDTKLIANLDYPPNTIENFGPHQELLQYIYSLDFVWAQEPFQQAYLNYVLNMFEGSTGVNNPHYGKNRTVPLIPHPLDVESYLSLRVPYDLRMNHLMFCYHSYDKHEAIPSMLAQQVPATTLAVGYVPNDKQPNLALWDFAMTRGKPLEWEKYLVELAHCVCAMEFYTINSQSRFVAECAALAVPCVGTSRSYNMQYLYPFTCVEPEDLMGYHNLLQRICGKKWMAEDNTPDGADIEFVEKVCKYADEKVQEYKPEARKQQLLEAMKTWEIEVLS